MQTHFQKLCIFEMPALYSGFTFFFFLFVFCFLKEFSKVFFSKVTAIQIKRIIANKQFSYSVFEFPLRSQKEQKSRVAVPQKRRK